MFGPEPVTEYGPDFGPNFDPESVPGSGPDFGSKLARYPGQSGSDWSFWFH